MIGDNSLEGDVADILYKEQSTSNKETDINRKTAIDDSALPAKTRKATAHFCEFVDQLKGQCKQRAINGFKYCIRHILLDPNAPYKQCQHKRKPKSKHEDPVLCTNAIRAISNEIYCSTHLIMKGMKDPKNSVRKDKEKSSQIMPNREEAQEVLDCNYIQNKYTLPMNHSVNGDQYITSNIANEYNGRGHTIMSQKKYQQTFMDLPNQNAISSSNNYEQLIMPSVESENFTQFQTPSSVQLIKSEINVDPRNDTNFNNKKANGTSTNNISKTFPQLAAKLLHQTNQEKKTLKIENNMIEWQTNSNEVIMGHNKILDESNPAKVSKYIEQPIIFNRERMANVEPLTSAICSLSSPLLFLNNEPPPRHYDLNRVEQNLSSTEFEEENELLKFQKDYSNDFDLPLSMRKRKQKVIKLLQKRQKVRIDGIFRKIRVVDSICRVVENYDFDRTDLFPLGLEPSDDESSSDDSFPSFDETDPKDRICPVNEHAKNRLELYLLKKKLRLESARLVQRAKLCIPINNAASSKHYTNSTGAALRVRELNKKRGNFYGKIREHRLQQCSHYVQQQIQREGKIHFSSVRCNNFCLPWTRHCAEHMSLNVSQQLFFYCKGKLCNRPVPMTDGILFNGLCGRHYMEQQKLNRVTRNMEAPTKCNKYEFLGPHAPKSFPVRLASTSYDPSTSTTLMRNPANSIQIFDNYPCTSIREDHLNDVVDSDVSLASVAKDLGFDGRELTDMLEKLPVEDPFESEIEPDEENLLSGIDKDDSDEVLPGMTLGHSWADVEQFLLEQE